MFSHVACYILNFEICIITHVQIELTIIFFIATLFPITRLLCSVSALLTIACKQINLQALVNKLNRRL